jgi:predicted nucleic acid-binding protein
MRLAAHHLIRAKWSERIHDEWTSAVLRERPDITPTKVERIRSLMNEHGGDCLIEGFEKHIERIVLPDANDRHVVAAAIEAEADAVVTWNLSDFPESVLQSHGIAVWTPDQLLTRLLDADTNEVVRVITEHRASLKHPPRTVAEYLATFEQQRMTQTVQRTSRICSLLVAVACLKGFRERLRENRMKKKPERGYSG